LLCRKGVRYLAEARVRLIFNARHPLNSTSWKLGSKSIFWKIYLLWVWRTDSARGRGLIASPRTLDALERAVNSGRFEHKLDHRIVGHMMRMTFFALVCSASVAACATSVPLDEPLPSPAKSPLAISDRLHEGADQAKNCKLADAPVEKIVKLIYDDMRSELEGRWASMTLVRQKCNYAIFVGTAAYDERFSSNFIVDRNLKVLQRWFGH